MVVGFHDELHATACKAPDPAATVGAIADRAEPLIAAAAAQAAAKAARASFKRSLLHDPWIGRAATIEKAEEAAAEAAREAAANSSRAAIQWAMKNISAEQDSQDPYQTMQQDWDFVIMLVLLILLVCLVKHVSYIVYQWAHEAGAMHRHSGGTKDLASKLLPSLTKGSDQFHGMQAIPRADQISLAFESLGLTLKANGKCIMEGVTGKFVPGRLASIMGPSGAGKTTLLNTLCGKATYGSMTGSVFINGRKVRDIQELKPVMGFVPQDDIVHEDLTPHEQLSFNVRLRNHTGIDDGEVRRIVADIIAIMQLEEVQTTVVGNTETRGVSGGQRKRINIGLELAARPQVLFLDEPTSGLDATTALSIMKSIENLSKLGMTIVMVVHQPRYSLFELFEDVLLLGKGGHTVFSGAATLAKPYFESLGHTMPQFENPADWLMDIISGEHTNLSKSIPHFKPHALIGSSHSDASSSSLLSTEPEHEEMLASVERGSTDNVDMLSENKIIQGSCCARSSVVRTCLRFLFKTHATDATALAQQVRDYLEPPLGNETWLRDAKPGCIQQFHILVCRSLLKWWRQWRPHVICQMLLLCSALAAGVSARGTVSVTDHKFIINVYMAQFILALLTATTRSQVFGNDKPLFYRESASGIRVVSVYLSKIAWDTVSILIESFIYICCWYVASGAKGSLNIFIPSFLLVAFVGAGWGYFLSTFVPPHNSVLATVATISIAGTAFSAPNQVVSRTGQSPWSDLILQSSMFTWGTALCIARAVHEVGGCTEGGPCCDLMPADGKKLFSDYWHLTAFHDDFSHQQASCCRVLLLIAFVLYIAGYLSLKYKNREKQV